MDIQQQRQLKILVIGDACDDVYHYGKCEKLSPEAPVPIYKHSRTEKVGGMAKNVANNLEGLGCNVSLITNKSKITKERFIDEISFQHIIRVDKGENKKLSKLSNQKIEKINFKDYDGVVISDYDKGFIEFLTAQKISTKCHENNVDLFVDSKKSDLSCFSHAIVKINQVEYQSLSNHPSDSVLVVTRGPEGAMWNGQLFAPASVEIDRLKTGDNHTILRHANVCGAGDTFLAGLVVHYLSHRSFSDAINFANKCGAIAINNFGTHAITLEEIKKYYDNIRL
jgi:bifunctional ADP-heptose synthase (sugar kinase/adenylyltransferase)